MDKYEYKLKLDQMKSMAAEGNYASAAEIADSIQWKKVKNVSALVKAGEIYEQAGRFEESKELLLQAYDRSPIGRTIIYRLAEVAIKMKNFEEAQEFCDEFVSIAPHDNLKYVLRYNLSKAKGENHSKLISILEEYKAQEYTEEWAYELAYLYHEEGRSEECIEACDELILWFGDGPYVERALELKMLYQPLSKQQEEKYRQFKQHRAGILEIRPEDNLESGEIIRETVHIPQVEVSSSRFNTVNLQEEIAKSMQQIMDATEKDIVENSMDNIKKLVGEIPYLQIPHEKEDTEEVHIETDEEIDDSIKSNFNELLAEDSDGQMSLLVPEKKGKERQITGQLEIDDILVEWEKTKRAAEATLQEAEQRKLESAKARALQEAGGIMERLTEVIPKLNSGLTPKDLLEQEYLSKSEQEALIAEEMAEKTLASADQVKEALGNTGRIGLTAEEVMALTGVSDFAEGLDMGVREASNMIAEASNWVAPQLDNMPVEEAGKLVASMNDFLQKEIERLNTENSKIDEKIAAVSTEEEAEQEEVDIQVESEEEAEQEEVDIQVELEEEANIQAESEDETEQEEADIQVELEEEANIQAESEDETEQEEAYIQVELEEEAEQEGADIQVELEEEAEQEEADIQVELEDEAEQEEMLPEIELEPEFLEQTEEEKLPEIAEPEMKEEEIATVQVISELTQEQKEIFSYFVPISGMKEQLCQVLTGMIQHLSSGGNSSRGNLIIQGDRGCGKTVLATDVVKVLQKEIGRPNGKIGKIDGSSLNQKDIVQLFKKVSGGCLIIERAGEISKETAIKMALLMERETSGLVIIMEDTMRGISKVLAKSEAFASKFTEKITIPMFTSDELVSFAKTYANEAGYNIEEMAVLALYNRISNIQKIDQGTTLIEVKEIVDEAISRVEKGGIKKAFSILTARRYDENDYIILHEKDFEN